MRMRHIVICGLPGSTVFFHIVSLKAFFVAGGGEGIVIEHKMCVLIFSAILSETLSL